MQVADNTISFEVNQLGMSRGSFEAPEGTTVNEALEIAGIDELSSTESVWVDGAKSAHPDRDTIDDGDLLMVTGKKEGGRL